MIAGQRTARFDLSTRFTWNDSDGEKDQKSWAPVGRENQKRASERSLPTPQSPCAQYFFQLVHFKIDFDGGREGAVGCPPWNLAQQELPDQRLLH